MKAHEPEARVDVTCQYLCATLREEYRHGEPRRDERQQSQYVLAGSWSHVTSGSRGCRGQQTTAVEHPISAEGKGTPRQGQRQMQIDRGQEGTGRRRHGKGASFEAKVHENRKKRIDEAGGTRDEQKTRFSASTVSRRNTEKT